MKSKIKYTDGPLGKLKVIDDFLPPPEDLIFKKEAKKHHTSYQAKIRKLLDFYTAQHEKPQIRR